MPYTYKVLRYDLTIKFDGAAKKDGAVLLEEMMNECAKEGYRFVTFVDTTSGLKQDRVCVMEKEE